MVEMLTNLINGIIGLLKIPLLVIGGLYLMFAISIIINLCIRRFKGDKLLKGTVKRIKKKSALKRIFWDAPKQYVDDMYHRNPDKFGEHGLIIYTGRQGMGKTIAMTRNTLDLQAKYPLCNVQTNYGYTKENGTIHHWKNIVNMENGIYGQIVCLDELQNWFSSNQSKDFPPEMLTTITQNRKNIRLIQGTSQNFYLLAKAIRSQATQVRECFTLFGVLTIVRKRYPILDSEGNVQEWQNRGMYFFVHDRELREAYDTYKVIQGLVKSGFKEQPLEIVNNSYYVTK